MHADDQIKYLQQKEINKKKWDDCIDKAPNGLIYAYSFYLDQMAKHWDALVVGDYEAVMPLTWNKKFGFYYLYQPAFTAQLGVFGKNLDAAVTGNLVKKIPVKFRLIEISLNSGNFVDASPLFNHSRNYILDLKKSYEQLVAAYRENHRRNITKAWQAGCQVRKDVPVEAILKLNEDQLKHISGTKPGDYPNFKKLYDTLKDKQQAKTYAIVGAGNEILASAVFFFSHKRAYYILPGNHPDGKNLGASHALIDAFIRDHADNDLTLDFEGSDISSLAFFYEGFGARYETYPVVRINRLPWYVKLFK